MSGSLCFMPSRYHKEVNLLECQATPPFAGTYFTVQYRISWKWVAAFQLFNVWFIVPLLYASNFGFVHGVFFLVERRECGQPNFSVWKTIDCR